MRAVQMLIFLAAVFLTAACGNPSGSEACDDAAQGQCSIWRDCYCPAGDCTHEGVSLAEGTCEDELGRSCDQQASTLELPAQDVTSCVDALETLTCEDIRSADAQGRPTTPAACAYFF